MLSKGLARGLCLVKRSPSRNVTSAAVENNLGQNKQLEEVKLPGELAYKAAKPLKSMPGPSFWKFSWDVMKDPGLKLKIDQVCRGWFNQYGPIFILNVPGLASRVNIMDPESVQILLAKDGKYPIEMVFDFWVYYRNNIRKDLFPETGGLLGNHGKEWWRVRSLVQQDKYWRVVPHPISPTVPSICILDVGPILCTSLTD